MREHQLLIACRKGDLETIKNETKRDPSLFEVSHNKFTLACYACKYDRPEILDYLVHNDPRGWKIISKLEGKANPLKVAFQKDSGEIVRFLMENRETYNSLKNYEVGRLCEKGKINILRVAYEMNPREIQSINYDDFVFAVVNRRKKVLKFLVSVKPQFLDYIRDFFKFCRILTRSTLNNVAFCKFLVDFLPEKFEVFGSVSLRGYIYYDNLNSLRLIQLHSNRIHEQIEEGCLGGSILSYAFRKLETCPEVLIWLIENHKNHFGLFTPNFPCEVEYYLEGTPVAFNKMKVRILRKYLEKELESTFVFADMDEGLCHEVLNVVMQNTELLLTRYLTTQT